MRRLLLGLFAVCLLASPAGAQPSIVGCWTAAGIADDQTITVSGVTAGNLLVTVAFLYSTAQTITVSDNGSGTAWQHTTARPHTDGSITGRIAWKVAEGTVTTITLTSNASANTTGHACEVSGTFDVVADAIDGNDSGETPTGAPSTSQDVDTGVTPTTDVVLIGGVGASNSASFTGDPSGYTMVTDTANTTAGYRTGIASTNYTFATTTAAGERAVTVLAAFKEVSGGGGGGVPNRGMLLGVRE